MSLAVACFFISVFEFVCACIHVCKRKIGSNAKPAMAGCAKTVPVPNPISHQSCTCRRDLPEPYFTVHIQQDESSSTENHFNMDVN